MKKTMAAVGAFSISMAFVEAAVVVYLRLQYYPEGFSFPLIEVPTHIGLIEVIREVATIIMLVSVSWLAGRRLLERFAYFAFAFGVWDIFYYIFLKVTLNWPASILTEDVLFLIPLPWVGPVLAPVIVSLCLVGGGLIILLRERAGRPVTIGPLQWIVSVIGGMLVLASFMTDPGIAFQQRLPGSFNWPLFASGVCAGIAGFVWAARSSAAPR